MNLYQYLNLQSKITLVANNILKMMEKIIEKLKKGANKKDQQSPIETSPQISTELNSQSNSNSENDKIQYIMNQLKTHDQALNEIVDKIKRYESDMPSNELPVHSK